MNFFRKITPLISLSLLLMSSVYAKNVSEIVKEQYGIQEKYKAPMYLYGDGLVYASDNKEFQDFILVYDTPWSEFKLVSGLYIQDLKIKDFDKTNIDLTCIGVQEEPKIEGCSSPQEAGEYLDLYVSYEDFITDDIVKEYSLEPDYLIDSCYRNVNMSLAEEFRDIDSYDSREYIESAQDRCIETMTKLRILTAISSDYKISIQDSIGKFIEYLSKGN